MGRFGGPFGGIQSSNVEDHFFYLKRLGSENPLEGTTGDRTVGGGPQREIARLAGVLPAPGKKIYMIFSKDQDRPGSSAIDLDSDPGGSADLFSYVSVWV